MNNALQQDSNWLAQRVGMVTGSRVGAILGLSPFMTRDDVLREMVREHFGAESEFTGNAATDWGNQNESLAIALFEDVFDELVISTGFHAHPDHKWLGASPDGLLSDGLIEVKCPYGLRRETEPKFKAMTDLPHYYAQIQLQLAVTGRSRCEFFQWAPNGYHHETVMADSGWLLANMAELAAFHAEYCEVVGDKAMAAPHLEDKELQRSDSEWVSAEARYIALMEQKAKIEDDLKAERQHLIDMAEGKKVRGTQVLVFPVQREGSISYAKALKALAPDADLEPYRGKPTTAYTVKAL